MQKLASEDCIVKLGDFGLTCRLDFKGDFDEGENRYCARELINGLGPIDLRSADIFSLGASVYEIMLGYPLSAGGSEWHKLRDGYLDESLVHNGKFSEALLQLVHQVCIVCFKVLLVKLKFIF